MDDETRARKALRNARMSGGWVANRRLRIGTIAAALAVGAIVLIAVLPTRPESASGILAKAQAAVSDADAIFHYVQVIEDLDEKGSVLRREHSEVWFSGDQRRVRVLSFRDDGGERGALNGELVFAPYRPERRYRASTNEIFEFDSDVDGLRGGAVFDPREFYREAASAPNAKVDEIDYEGRKALRVTDAPGSGGFRFTLIVDAKTYLPMLQQQNSINVQHRPPYSHRYPTYERLDENAETRKLLEMSPHPGAKTVRCAADDYGCMAR